MDELNFFINVDSFDFPRVLTGSVNSGTKFANHEYKVTG